MSDPNEEIVDRVLQGLRDAAPLEGMESRIVSAVRHRASAMPAPSRSPWRRVSLGAGVVFAGVVCAVFFAAHRKSPQTLFPLPRLQAVSIQTANGFVASPQAAQPKPPQRAGRRPRQGAHPPPRAEGLSSVSYPAPPMPLTEQEKLLLRLAHKGDPVQFAMLDPQQRDQRNATEKAQFQQFFTRSISGDPQ